MAYLYRLNGEWDQASTNLFMKEMFCREVNYLNISEERVVFLKEWASLGAPFALTDYE